MKDILLNEELLETIRCYKSFGSFENEEIQNIVPPILRHEYLLNLRSIDKIIIKSYIDDNKRLMTKEEWLKLPNNLDFDIYSTAISPFPFIIAGAYHSRINLYIKLNALLHPFEKHTLKGNSNLKNLSDLKPYFTEYAQGFLVGYNQFEDSLIKPLLINLGVPDKQGYATEVFKFITKGLSKNTTTITTSGRGFTMTYISNGLWEINNGYEDGVYEGYLYRAWSIIFSQNELFLPIFKKYRDDTEKTKVLEKDVILKMDNNLIPRLKIEYVYDFFSVLTKPNTNGDPYLSEQKLLTFIESTFVNDDPIQQSFDVSLNKEKKNIRTVFKRFQDNCSEYEKNQKHLKQKYFDIMYKGFKGFSKVQDYKRWCETNPDIKTIGKASKVHN